MQHYCKADQTYSFYKTELLEAVHICKSKQIRDTITKEIIQAFSWILIGKEETEASVKF